MTQARSSDWLERYLDTVEVSGSSPLGPTSSLLKTAIKSRSVNSGILRLKPEAGQGMIPRIAKR